MIRTLTAVAITATFGLTLSACGPGGSVEATEGLAGRARGEPVPQAYDWRFLAHEASSSLTIGHGGNSHELGQSRMSGELTFGDDAVEPISLFRLTCAPQSRTVEVSWGYPGEAVLTSGTATGTFRAREQVGLNDPVLNALKDNGVLAVGLSGADMTLKAKGPGRNALAAFFDYCERGPATPVAPPPVLAEVTATDPATDEAVAPVETVADETVVEDVAPAAEGVPAA